MTDATFTPLVPPRLGQVVADARTVAEKARVRGYADGFAEGRRRAQDDLARAREDLEALAAQREIAAREELDSALAAVQAVRTAWEERLAALVGADAERVEDLAIDLAETILGVELSDAARSAAHAVRRAAAEAAPATWVRLTLSERDARTLRDGDAVLPGTGEIIASTEVGPGGAVVELGDVRVDTRVSSALARAREALRQDTEGDALR